MMPKGLTFEPLSHVYTLDGRVVPSVTGILRYAGLIDFSSIPGPVLEKARARGSVVHSAVHYFNENDLDLDAFFRDFPDWTGYLEAWLRFTDQRQFKAALSEHRVASRRYQVAGTVDCFGYLDGEPVLLDFATGNPADVAKDLQTAAYYALGLEWAGDGDDPALATFLSSARGGVRRYGVALRKDGTFRVEPYTGAADFRDFLTLVAAHRIVTTRRGAVADLEVSA